MDIEEICKFCLALPFVTEEVAWANDLSYCLTFYVGKIMFMVTRPQPLVQSISFKCTPEKFAELIEKDGIIPARYDARYHWVTVEKPDALKADELKNLIKNSYQMVWEELPKGVKDNLISQ